MGNKQSKASSDSSHVCDQPGFDTTPTTPFVGSYDFYHFNMILSGACAAFAVLSILALMFRHATRFSQPKEQSDILRICAFIPIYAIGTFIEIAAPQSYVYLQGWLEVAQAFALASFFLLVCRLLTAETDDRVDVFLAPMRIVQRKTGESTAKAVGVYRKRWLFVFQYPVVSILLALLTDITQGADKYCFGSHQAYFASIWMDVFGKISMALAFISVLRTYMSLKVELRAHRALQKLLAFKLLIGLQFIQQVVYMILTRINPSPLAPTDQLNYTDMEIGIPLMLVSLELVIFAIFFHFAYSVTPYVLTSYSHNPPSTRVSDGHHSVGSASYHGGFLGIRAWAALLNPGEFIAAFLFAFNMHQEAAARGPGRDSYDARAPGELQSPPKYTYDSSYGRDSRDPRANESYSMA